MSRLCIVLALVVLPSHASKVVKTPSWPLVINTWNFTNAAAEGWKVVSDEERSALDGIEFGISLCERERCHGSVGWGGNPDEDGETTLDAMIMDGPTHDVGAVGCLRRVKNAIGVARKVLEHTEQTLLVGDLATQFALENGFKVESLLSNESYQSWKTWREGNCQPNFRKDVKPNSTTSCGPYTPIDKHNENLQSTERRKRDPSEHDTIGMVVIDKKGHIASGTSTNGLRHKIPGRVGDSPIPGSGSYADQEVGGAAATGDGDVMMRFAPTYHAVEMMRQGHSPLDAANDAITRIGKKYPTFTGAIIVVNISGDYAAACWGLGTFPFSVANQELGGATLEHVECVDA